VQIALYIPPCLPIEYQRFRILKELFRSLFVLEVQVKMMFFNHKHLTSNDHRKNGEHWTKLVDILGKRNNN
jgi:hypothetical protein